MSECSWPFTAWKQRNSCIPGGLWETRGGLYENLLAGILARKALPLYYFKNEDGTREVEFMLERDGGVVPVEVKASNGTTISLDEALQNPRVPYGYKFIDGNVGVSGKKITLPHYMAMFI